MNLKLNPALALLLLASACSPAGLNVTGKVLDYNGQPAAFLPVMVGGKVTSTDASGNFSVSGVSSPYQLVVLQPTQKYAQIYEGVTRPDPIVLVFQAPANNSLRKSKLTVNFSGSGSGSGLMDVANPVNSNGGVTGSVATPGTSYSTDLQWAGPSNFEGNICAILYQNTANVATAINAFGQRDRVFFQDAQPTTTGVVMNAVQSKTISGSVTVPAGFTLTSKTLGFVCGGNATRPSYPFTFDTSSTTNFSYTTPVTPNILHMAASAKKGDVSLFTQQFGLAPDATGVSLVLPQPIEQLQPANNALGIAASATFSWSPTTVGISQVTFNPVNPGPTSLSIYTSGSSLTLPDLSALGYALPKGTAFTWMVNADSNTQTISAALSGVPRNYLNSYSQSLSDKRQFTTAP